MNQEMIVFKLIGDWAHFKRPYTTTSPLTFDLPSPPTILGIIGAIVGLDKSRYLSELSPHCRISVSLIGPPRKMKTGIKLLDTQSSAGSFRGMVKDQTTGIMTTRDNPTVPIELELLGDVSYLVFCQIDQESHRQSLLERLSQHRPYYSISLGLAWCLADFELVGVFRSEPVQPSEDVEVLGWLPKSSIAKPKLEEGKRYSMMTLPIKMQAERIVSKYDDMIYEYSGKTIRCNLKNGEIVWKFNHGGKLEFGEDAHVYIV